MYSNYYTRGVSDKIEDVAAKSAFLQCLAYGTMLISLGRVTRIWPVQAKFKARAEGNNLYQLETRESLPRGRKWYLRSLSDEISILLYTRGVSDKIACRDQI